MPLKRLRTAYAFVAHQVLSILLLYALAEGVVRLVLPPVEPIEITARTLLNDNEREPFFEQHPFAAHAWIPNARFGPQTVNGDGFVSTRDIPLARTEDEVRIVTLGGSSTVGSLNRDHETYPRQLEDRLQTTWPARPVSVINAAAGGYTTMESLGYLQRRMVYYRPDVVLIMHGWNDLYYFTLSDRRLSERRKHLYDKALWTPWNLRREPLPPVVRVMGWSQLFLHLRAYVESRQFFRGGAPAVIEVADTEGQPASPTQTAEPINPTAYDTYRTNLQQIRAFCEIRAIDCYSILQPTLIAQGVDRAHPVVREAWETAWVHGFDGDTHIGVFEDLYAINREVFGDDHVIDATGLSGDVTLFHDHIHMNAAGSQRLATLVHDVLTTRSES